MSNQGRLRRADVPPTAPDGSRIHDRWSGLDVVIAHDWITVPGGSETVVQELCRMFPQARIVTAVSEPDTALELFPGHQVETLPMGRLPGTRRHWPYYAPAMLAAWAAHRTAPADVLVCSSHFAALGAARRFRGPSLAYVHTPMRVAWRPDLEQFRLPGPLSPAARMAAPVLRRVDRSAARHVDAFVANSSAVAGRIADAYGRPSTVVAPPVDVASLADGAWSPGDYLLVFGRLVGYKRVDLAVEACTRLGVRLVVAGDGPERARLEALAGPSVEFVGRVDDHTRRQLYASARALVFPGEEDFGIVPVEAQAAGCPVIAFGRGGALDSVDPALGNVLVEQQDVDTFVAAIARLLDGPDHSGGSTARRRAMARFAPAEFRHGISQALAALLD